jgi:transcriptional regulator with GAF, ATPase, and Fis domain
MNTGTGQGFSSTHPSAPPSGYTGPGYALTLVYPPELAGQSIALAQDLTLGRSPDEGVVCVFHSTVSRRHAAIIRGLGGVLCLRDLDSRNGSKLNGKRPELPTPLTPQVVVRLGDVLGVVDEACERRFEEDLVLPGRSPRMARAREQLERAATDSAPILIMGETGTGKERLASEAHQRSGRSGPYLALNCAELSAQLIESQLFGHERGAFTGATAAAPGLFRAANGGTLFLDEIGELSTELQPKLLRVLQEGEVRSVGSVRAERVDVRVVTATNKDLPALVDSGKFRRDLYARLSLWEIRLPPLRERRQDILTWLGLLASVWGRRQGASGELRLLPDAAECVVLHPWHDNLRGLDRIAHRLASLGEGRPISLRTLSEALPELALPAPLEPAPLEPAPLEPNGERRASSLPPGAAGPSREELLAVYLANGRSVRATAKHFGKERRQIYRWLERFEIPRGEEDD